MDIRLKRVYLPPENEDGTRILIDRLWPRGLSKQKANVDLWLKDIAPSDELRKWFNHQAEKWEQFQKQYRAELNQNQQPVAKLAEQLKEGKVTLVFASKDNRHNNAIVLKNYLEENYSA